MRMFVTGGSGFIGRHLLSLFGNHEVMCLSHQRTGFDAGAKAQSNVRTIQGDLSQPESWFAQVEQFSPHCCIHLAWEGLPDYSPERCQRNLNVGLGLINWLARAHVNRIIVTGSCWEYGAANGAVAESHTPKDCGLFATTKHALRTALERVALERGIAYRWARIFFAYGPGQRASSLIPQCWAAFKAGKRPDIRQPRVAQDFVHVDDVARGLLAMVECDMASGIYNVGSGTPAAVSEVVNHVAEYLSMGPLYPNAGFDDGFWADTKKMVAATGWRAQIELRDGIAHTLQALDAA
jgi:nucleoside-diphosphate-sugar epimerase